MSEREILKKYSLNIDFLDYEKKRNVTKDIVYSEGDVNTAFIYATLTMGGEVIDLEGHTVTVGIKNNDGEELVNGCEVADAKNGKIIIPFTSSSLSDIGFNKFEVVIYKGDKKIVSPTFVYRVAESVYNEGNVEDSNHYDVLLVLISQVQGALDSVKEVADRVEGLEGSMIDNEADRKLSEEQRKRDELIRQGNEILRQTQEQHRDGVFNEKIGEINELTTGIREDLDNKLAHVDTELTKMTDSFNEKSTIIDGKIKEVDDKLVSVDAEVVKIIDTKFDGKVEEIITHVDTVIDNKTTTKFEEVDRTLSQKLTETNVKVDAKLEEATKAIANVGGKIQEMDTTIDRNVAKVDDKIAEVNIVKTQLVNDVNAKITEVDETKTNLTNSIDTKMTEFEDRFSALESANPIGELTQSRISVDGTLHDTLAKRLTYDYEKKANADSVYNKTEIDSKIEGITSVDDSTISTQSTWSSDKVSKEIIKSGDKTLQDSKSYTDSKVASLVGQSPELLDTLEELSNALGNDPNFATTITSQIAQKANTSDVYSKSEIDKIVGASTSIDDTTVSTLTTWSSTKTNSELNKKVSKEAGKGLSSNDYTDEEKSKLAGLNNYVHPNDANTRHVSDSQISKWDSKADGNHVHTQYSLTGHKHSYSELNDLPNIPSKVSELQNDSGFVTRDDVHVHLNKDVLDKITQEKLTSWDGKSDKSYVDSELGKKANSANVYSKSEVDSLVANVSSIDDSNVSPDTTWSSTKINSMLSSSNNLGFDKLVAVGDWTQGEDGNFYCNISHKMGTERILVSAIDFVSKEAILLGYKIVDKNTITISSTSATETFVTIVNGDNQIQISNESDTRKNVAYDKVVPISEWVMENGLATTTIAHKLFTERIFVSAVDVDTKDSIKIAYKIISDTSVKVQILNPMNALVTVINGNKEYLHLTKESEISDDVVTTGATWSSKKIQDEISRAVSSISLTWGSITEKPTEFNPAPHDHDTAYYRKAEVDTIVEPIGDEFIDGLFTPSTIEYNGVKYYTAQEIDNKFNELVSMIEALKK